MRTAFLLVALPALTLAQSSTTTSNTSPATTLAPVYNGTALNLYGLGAPGLLYNGSVVAADSVSTTWAITCNMTFTAANYIYGSCPQKPFLLTQSSRNYQFSYVQTETVLSYPVDDIWAEIHDEYTTLVQTVTQSSAVSLTTNAAGQPAFAFAESQGVNDGMYIYAGVLATVHQAVVTVVGGKEKIAAASTVSRTATDVMPSMPTGFGAQQTGANASTSKSAASGRIGVSEEHKGVTAGLFCATALVGMLAFLL